MIQNISLKKIIKKYKIKFNSEIYEINYDSSVAKTNKDIKM